MMVREYKKMVFLVLVFFLLVATMQHNVSGNKIEQNVASEKFYRVFVHSIGPIGKGGIDGTHAIIPGFGIDYKIDLVCEKGWYKDSTVVVRNFSGEILYTYTRTYWLNITHFTGWMFPSGFLIWIIPPAEIFPIPVRIVGLCEELEITPI